MSTPPDERRAVLRVLVALDTLPATSGALDALAGLTGGMEAELLGLFVEDARLLELAALPFSHEVTRGGATHRPLSSARLERQLRAQATRARELLAHSAASLQARHSFRVTRGELVSEVLHAARGTDTLVLSLRRWSGPGIQRLVTESAPTVLLLREPWHAGRSVVVLYDDSPAAGPALHTAARIARTEGLGLCVLVTQRSGHGPEQVEREIVAELGSALPGPRFRRMGTLDPALIADLARAEGARLLVLPGGSLKLDRRGLHRLMDRARCALAFAR